MAELGAVHKLLNSSPKPYDAEKASQHGRSTMRVWADGNTKDVRVVSRSYISGDIVWGEDH